MDEKIIKKNAVPVIAAMITALAFSFTGLPMDGNTSAEKMSNVYNGLGCMSLLAWILLLILYVKGWEGYRNYRNWQAHVLAVIFSAGMLLGTSYFTNGNWDFLFGAKKQILIYPAVNNCYTEKSPYRSVQENGEDYLLTAVKMEDYLKLYESSPDDRQNPYFAPILEKDLSHMPDTLILTAEFDPLRDEGEAYGKRLEEAGNYVEVHRIPEALHGYFALGIRFLHVQESFEIMNKFLEKEADKTWKQDIQNGEN